MSRIFGFTLIELLVAISIIGVLTAVGVSSYVRTRASSRDARRLGDARAFVTAFERYYAGKKVYPNTGTCDGDGLATTATCCSSWTQNYIAAFAPTYIDKLPHDPQEASGGPDICYGVLIPRYLGYKLTYDLERRNDRDAIGDFEMQYTARGVTYYRYAKLVDWSP